MQIKKTVLSNGLRVVTAPIPHLKSITVLLLVGVGSRYDEEGHQGMAHFIEHMMFKGTERRPTPLVIATEMDEVGAEFNAYTGEECVGLYVKVALEHLSLALDVLSDMFLYSKFEPREIGREKEVILEEIRMYLDVPQACVDDLFNRLVFGDHPLGSPIVGQEEAIKAIERVDLLDYVDSWFRPGNTVVAVAGGVSHREVIAQVGRQLGEFKPAQVGKPLPLEVRQEKPEVLTETRDTKQTHLNLGVRGYRWGDPRRYAYTVLNTVLGKGMSSRLFMEVRGKRGLAYYVASLTNRYTDAGTLVACAGVNNHRLEEALRVILDQFRQLKSEPVPPRELAKAKTRIRGEFALAVEDSGFVAQFLAVQELLENKIETLEELMAKTDAVTAEEVQDVAQELFVSKGLNLALIGPVKDEARLLPLLDLS